MICAGGRSRIQGKTFEDPTMLTDALVHMLRGICKAWGNSGCHRPWTMVRRSNTQVEILTSRFRRERIAFDHFPSGLGADIKS